MKHLDHRRGAAVLLPLAGGLAVAAVAQLSIAAVILPVNVVLLVLLGAVIPERPWRTAVLSEAPGLALALGRATGQSWMLVGLVVVVAPLFVAISAVLVKAGTSLRRDGDECRAEGAEEVGRSTGDRGLFATKARRGAFLIVLVTLLATCNGVLAERWGDEADHLARKRAEEIRIALSGRTPQSLRQSALDRSYGGAGEPVPGGPYLEQRPGPEEFRASAEVRSGPESRCIRVRVGADAVVQTEIEDGGC